MQNEPRKGRLSIRYVMPWIVAVAALIGYLVTLNPWVSFMNLPQIARLSGWSWTPEVNGPAYYLITLPLRWLPVQWIPLALNSLSALCAALALYQLARSVTLLPHDRTHEQRLREHGDFSILSIPLAWLPPLLAALVCGLQLTFWEHATNGTGEMFDLLLFAYVIRSLLEYRIDGRESRLVRAAFVYGVGMTNNFAMVGFFPLFIVAIVWLRGLSFFHFGFLSRMALWGLIGLLFYLVLPLVDTFSSTEPVGFWAALKANVLAQKDILSLFPKKTVLILCVTSLLPVLVMAIKWASYFGDTSKLGTAFATLTFHFAHAVLLLVCLWAALDPPFGARQKGYGFSFLTFFYLGALSIGYFSGYFLLVFRQKSLALQTVSQVATGLICVLLVIVPAGLIYKNLPGIRTTNGPAVRQFAAALADGLPKNGALVSDDWYRLSIVRSWLARDGREKDFLFVDTQALKLPRYHRFLHNKYPQRWEAPPDNSRIQKIGDPVLITRMIKLAKDTDIYYLHPSFGYYFEVFYPEPHGLVFALKRYGSETLVPPKHTQEIINRTEAFWSGAAGQILKPLLAVTAPGEPGEKPSLLDRLFEACRIPREENAQSTLLGMYYSRSLNYWGVEMQTLGELEKAAAHFNLARQLNPDNVPARINLECNKNLRAGIATPITFTKSIEERLGKYRSWEQVVNANGPFDEPELCYAQAWIFMQNRLYRQAAQNFDRVIAFSPDNYPSRLSMAQLYLLANLPDNAIALINEMRGHPDRFKLTTTNLTDLLAVEASAWFVKKEPVKARDLLETAIQKTPKDVHLLASAVSIYAQRGDFTNALSTVERRLKLDPDNVAVLITKAFIYIHLEEFNAAITTLNRTLTIEPENPQALLNRAIAYLRLERLDDSKEDYKTLEKIYPAQYQVLYGLGEIARRQNDTNAAIRYYSAYLTNMPPASAEARFVADRLSQLKGEKTK